MKTASEIFDMVGQIENNDLNFMELLKQCSSAAGIVPFVGAGLSCSFGYPKWSDFLGTLGKSAMVTAEVGSLLKEFKFEEAASLVRQKLGRDAFEMQMKKSFGDDHLPSERITGAVAYLPKFRPGPVITTNFDRVIERVYAEANIPISVAWRSQAEQGSAAMQQGRSILLKLHGDWEESANRVLTKEEYAGAYGGLTEEKIDYNLPIPSLLTVLLASRALLFLGCGLEQDRTMRVIAKASAIFNCKHYALLSDEKNSEERRRTLSDLNIRPIWYPRNIRDQFIPECLEFLAKTSWQLVTPHEIHHQAKKYPKGVSTPVTAIIGRAEEMRVLHGLLRGLRMVTIVGAGGCGKSRIATEVASELAPEFNDRIWFVELADLSPKADKEELLPSRIGRVIGVPQQPTLPPLDGLAHHFKDEPNLLVLDNCEHLIASCSKLIEDLLKRCAGLKILVTSRKRLGISKEQIYLLSPLQIPLESSGIAELNQNESVMLFTLFARKQNGVFEITPSNAKPIAELCQALDGIPLAIELAAVGLRLKSISPKSAMTAWKDLAGAIKKQNVQPGSSGSRHWETLSAALEWSYKLLSKQAREVLQILTIFDGGWTDESANSVCNPLIKNPKLIPDLLHELQENSLIVTYETNETHRFRLLVPVREFVRSKMKADSEMARRIAVRHAEVFTQMMEEAAPNLLKASQEQWLEKLQLEADNLRAAMRWAVDGKDANVALRLAASVWRFLEIRGYYIEGRNRLREALSVPGVEQFPVLLERVLAGAGWLAYRQSDYADAKILLERSLQISEQEHDDDGIGNALNDLANIAAIQGEYDIAETRFNRYLELVRKAGNPRGVSVAHCNLGVLALSTERFDEAGRFLTESVYGFRQQGNLREAAFPLRALGELALHRQQWDLARNYTKESLEIRIELKDSKGQAESHCTLAHIEILTGQPEAALHHLEKCLNLAKAIGDRRTIVQALEIAALVHLRKDLAPLTIELMAAADRIRKSIGYVMPPVRRKEYDALGAEAESRLDVKEVKAFQERGLARETDELIDSSLKAIASL